MLNYRFIERKSYVSCNCNFVSIFYVVMWNKLCSASCNSNDRSVPQWRLDVNLTDCSYRLKFISFIDISNVGLVSVISNLPSLVCCAM